MCDLWRNTLQTDHSLADSSCGYLFEGASTIQSHHFDDKKKDVNASFLFPFQLWALMF